jgi:hypothetical protein
MTGILRSRIIRLVRAGTALAGRRIWVWAGLLGALALALDFVPLFDLLGYDFAFALGLLMALASVDIGHGVVAAAAARIAPKGAPGGAPQREPDGEPGVWRLVGRAAAAALGTAVLPLLISCANSLRVRNCNLGAGLAFFALLPASTAVYGAGLGALAGMALPRRAGRLVALGLPLASLGWALVRLYVDPPVFAYDPFGGYFPGPIYDEALRPPATLGWFRIANAAWLLTAISAVSLWRARRVRGGWPGRAVMFAGLLLLSAYFWVSRGTFGFHVRQADLARLLDSERHSNRVVLRYASTAGMKPADVDLLMQDLEFRYDQLREIFGTEPRGPITVFDFPSADEKKAWVGAGGTLYAKPWKRQIFVQGEGFPARRLRHEMAHVFAGAFGDRFFGVALAWRWHGPLPLPHLASGLVEGIAEAADFTDPDGGSTTHQEAAALLHDGHAPALTELMGAGFSAVSGPRAYTVAGSFVRYLLETRGAERLRAIYATAGDFEHVYGTSLGALEDEWKRFLRTQTLSGEQRARAREQFRRPAIFRKVCAREQAARVAEARGLLGAAPARAVALLEQSSCDDPGEPTIRIDLAQALAAAGEPVRALQVLAALARNGEITAPVRARAAAVAAAVHFQRGEVDNARQSILDVLASATDEGERRLAGSKLRALADEGARRTLGRALFGDDVLGNLDPVLLFYLVSEFARLTPDEALGPYLVGRQLAFRDPAAALPVLRLACVPVVPGAEGPGPDRQALPTDVRRECLRLAMVAAFKIRDLAQSRQAAEALRRESSEEAERLRAGDFLERIDWQRAKM